MNQKNSWPDYDPRSIEPKLQDQWEKNGLYLARETGEKPKFYCLDFFPYPSGDGLHVGHCRNYIPTDVISRYKRMKGFNVLHPMGWDAFGEPAEQYAVKHGVHPRITTDRNTANFRRQMALIGDQLRLVARDRFVRSGVLPMDAVFLPPAVPGGVGLQGYELAVVVRRLPDYAIEP